MVTKGYQKGVYERVTKGIRGERTGWGHGEGLKPTCFHGIRGARAPPLHVTSGRPNGAEQMQLVQMRYLAAGNRRVIFQLRSYGSIFRKGKRIYDLD